MLLIPRGSTQKNVNKVVFDSISGKLDQARLLIDAPCGSGEFAHFLGENFSGLKVIGVDLFTDPKNKKFEFQKAGAHEVISRQAPESVDIVTCISGVMCFDGVPQLIAAAYKALKANGVLVITNDNIMSVRDRLNFLFFGHFKRFKLLYAKNEGNWNVVLPQALVSQLQSHGFRKWQMKYTAIYNEDFFFLPLAFVIYPVFLLNLLLRKSDFSVSERLALFPFRMLISRHYVITAEK